MVKMFVESKQVLYSDNRMHFVMLEIHMYERSMFLENIELALNDPGVLLHRERDALS